jgi:hypothetical protein
METGGSVSVEPERLCVYDVPAIALFDSGEDISELLSVDSMLALLAGPYASGVKGVFATLALKLGFRECWTPLMTDVCL